MPHEFRSRGCRLGAGGGGAVTIFELLATPPKVINVGVTDFASALVAQGAEVVNVRWSPPANIDPELERLLEKLL